MNHYLTKVDMLPLGSANPRERPKADPTYLAWLDMRIFERMDCTMPDAAVEAEQKPDNKPAEPIPDDGWIDASVALPESSCLCEVSGMTSSTSDQFGSKFSKKTTFSRFDANVGAFMVTCQSQESAMRQANKSVWMTYHKAWWRKVS